MTSVGRVLNDVCRGFDTLGVELLVGGSFASGVWGQPRQTNDLNVAILLLDSQVDPLVSAFNPAFMVDAEEIWRSLGEEVDYRSFQLLHFEEVFKVDVFLPHPNEYTASEFARRRKVMLLEDDPASCAAPENVIIQKLRWFELGNRVSDRQWNDIVQVLEIQKGRLDFDYLLRWTNHFGLLNLLNEAINQTR